MALVVSSAASFAAAAPSISLAQEREAAVLTARSGQLALALQEFARLRREFPDNHALIIDQTLVLSWANEDAQVVANAHLIDQQDDAPQVLAAVAKSFRNLQQFESSIEWYRMLQKRESAALDATLGLAMTLADAGRFADANAELAELSRDERDSLAALQAQAFVFQLEGRDVECLPLYDAMLALNPGDRKTLRQKALLLRDMRLPELAMALAEGFPSLLSDEEIEHLEADVIALSIRSAARTYSPQGTEWQSSVQVLAQLDEHIASTPSGTALRRRLRGDRLVALVDIGLMQDAIAEFQALSAENMPLTRLERYSAARAYLATGQAETARQLLLGCLQEAPKNYDCRVEYFYALLELRQFEEASIEAESMVAKQPVIDPETLKPNPKYLDARLRAVLARTYTDRLDEAQKELEGITADIPNNPSARAELASTYLWRGWPDRALSEFQQALTIYPQHVAARTGWTTTQLARQQFRQAGDEISQLQQQFPHSNSVKQLSQRWRLHRKSTLLLDASIGDSSGSTFGSKQYTVQGWWLSPPVNDWYRIYLRSFDGFAELPEGDSHRSRAAAGVDYRRGDWSARTEVSGARAGGDAGMSLEVNWRMSDLWSLAAAVDVNSYDTPLRAYENDVKSNRLQMRTTYAPNELLSLGSSFTYSSFDDGNRRSSLSLYGQKRVINLPGFKLNATGSIFTSQSTLDDASYFNPRADQSAVVGADMRWTHYFTENRQLYLRVFPQAGTYLQQSNASNLVWSLDLELGVRFGQRLSMQLGAQRARRAYDGSTEFSDFLLLGIEARL